MCVRRPLGFSPQFVPFRPSVLLSSGRAVRAVPEGPMGSDIRPLFLGAASPPCPTSADPRPAGLGVCHGSGGFQQGLRPLETPSPTPTALSSGLQGPAAHPMSGPPLPDRPSPHAAASSAEQRVQNSNNNGGDWCSQPKYGPPAGLPASDVPLALNAPHALSPVLHQQAVQPSAVSAVPDSRRP